jgi:hypothetical protein
LTAPFAPAAEAPAVLPLLADGALRLEAAPGLLPLLRRWLPLLPYDAPAVFLEGGAAIRLARLGRPPAPPPDAPPTLRLGSVDAWVDDAQARVVMHGRAGCFARIALAGGEALLQAPDEASSPDRDAVAWDLYSMATVSSALLLGRMGRALVHAAAVVAPGGGSWLLAGDTHAGKSTTCVNLIDAGWAFVSDDHVVLSRGADGALAVEGWPRRFHLDEGWEAGETAGRRGEVDPHRRWPGRWRRAAPLAGLLFPRVEADRPTALSPLAPSGALAGVVRQSPWLVADRAAAPGVLALLRAACEAPAFSLRLGLDSYRDTDRLLGVLAPLAGG